MSASNRRSIRNYLLNPNFRLNTLNFAASGVAVMGFLFATINLFLFAIFMAHRFTDPSRVIKTYLVKEITAGQYDANRTLHKSDDEQCPIAAVQQQAATLEAKSGGQS